MKILYTRNGHRLGAWQLTDEESYDEALGAVPPQSVFAAGFLMGEPVSSLPDGVPVWRAYVLSGGSYWKALVTHATLNHYLEELAMEQGGEKANAKAWPATNLMEFAAQGGTLHPEPLYPRRPGATLAEAQKAGRDYAKRVDENRARTAELLQVEREGELGAAVAKAACVLVSARRAVIEAELKRDSVQTDLRKALALRKKAGEVVADARVALNDAVDAAAKAGSA